MDRPLVSIVIPTHNRKDMVVRLLSSLFGNTYKHIEVIVVDDASSDGTSELVIKKYKNNKQVSIIRNSKNLYTAGSRNVGAKKAKGEYIFFIDDDNVLDRQIIEKLVDEMESDKAIGEVGPVNYSYINKKKMLWAGTNRNMTTSFTKQRRNLEDVRGEKSWQTDDVPNAFMVRTSVVRKHAITFREKYGIMYEESDYAYRIRQNGYTIRVVRDAIIYHDVETTVDGGKSKDYMYHFMSNKRRPYVTARNRLLFHATFSTPAQVAGIIVIWSWVFAAYYAYKMLSYNGAGKFSFVRRIELVIWYLKGIFDGIVFVVSKQKLS